MPAQPPPIHVFIVSFNRVTWLPDLVTAAYRFDNIGEVYIVDNGSTYPPLLEYYQRTPAKVIYLEKNLGHRSAWISGVIEHCASPYYVVTDPDLDIRGVPRNCLLHLYEGMQRYKHKHINKVGLSLEINDVPKTQNTEFVRRFEQDNMWSRPLDREFFECTVDTTFALYDKYNFTWDINPVTHHDFTYGLRANRPYTARHMPWYCDPTNPSEEDMFIWSTLRTDSAGWTYEQAKKAGVRE
ncbi:MAG: glycosyltransferase [Armatimonadetes bacterium]|nr:glycosyltransferase [Armatimonadota bacterium]